MFRQVLGATAGWHPALIWRAMSASFLDCMWGWQPKSSHGALWSHEVMAMMSTHEQSEATTQSWAPVLMQGRPPESPGFYQSRHIPSSKGQQVWHLW